MQEGRIIKIAGPVVVAEGMKGSQMYEVVRVGEERLIGEIIELKGDKATIQVYEETAGIQPGEKVVGTGAPLSVELGPGLLKKIFDGILRPLDVIRESTGIFIRRGVEASSLDRKKKWEFKPLVKKRDKVKAGDFLGEVQETKLIVHKIMVPPSIEGEVVEIVNAGRYTVEKTIAKIKTKDGVKDIKMYQKWPVRRRRPFKEKLDPSIPLITGQRVVDTFFPVAKGGTASIPGPFGAGKTVLGHQLAKWSDAQVFIYIGCGERGNEMTEVLEEFPELIDPWSGKPLMERTVLIANTSNMPVAAREASIYTGITLAEYYRDMGYSVALMADSTSRWAEAMREISGRLEEMPGEEGYPAYLASRLAEFYERAGRVITLGSEPREGSLTVVGAVSPPGGDFSEPVTQNTLRITKAFWGLDASLADRRHFPAINWLRSYSLYADKVKEWWSKEVSPEWAELRVKAMALLQKEAELQEIVQLVGPDALPERERITLEGARVIREDFLQQNAFHEVDSFCSPKKQFKMLKIMIHFYDKCLEAVTRGLPAKQIAELEVKDDIARLKYVEEDKIDDAIAEIEKKIEEQINELATKLGGM
ncbi:MAG: ATP synthase subunit A [Candidatus Hydrothermarchaeota archaeon]|nr:MAG: ATP synthase subunit A [Candidatus Hydrothermarchaeota archaeon]